MARVGPGTGTAAADERRCELEMRSCGTIYDDGGGRCGRWQVGRGAPESGVPVERDSEQVSRTRPLRGLRRSEGPSPRRRRERPRRGEPEAER